MASNDGTLVLACMRCSMQSHNHTSTVTSASAGHEMQDTSCTILDAGAELGHALVMGLYHKPLIHAEE